MGSVPNALLMWKFKLATGDLQQMNKNNYDMWVKEKYNS
jgi:hypothetical protein